MAAKYSEGDILTVRITEFACFTFAVFEVFPLFSAVAALQRTTHSVSNGLPDSK